jgi:hypothetical protein
LRAPAALAAGTSPHGRPGSTAARPEFGLSERFWLAWNSAAAELPRPVLEFLRLRLKVTLKTLSTMMQPLRRNPQQLNV